jgi:NRPS condensation-like uncharacterized protein
MARLKPPASGKKKPSALSKPSPNETKLCQFKVPADKHQEIKVYAAENGFSIQKLFMTAYEEYRAKHG